MKIVIASPYKIANYGAILQAWALRIVLERMGHEVQFLNCDWMWRGYSNLRRLICSRSLTALVSKLKSNKMMIQSVKEMGGLPESRKYSDYRDIQRDPPQADCYLAGSDQIFGVNYFCDKSRYEPVLLDFGAPHVRRIAYGASFGTDDAVTYEKYGYLAELLKRFAAIGIREQSGLDILNSWAGLKGSWTPDPVFLVDKKDYVDAFHLEQRKSDYVCTYLLSWSGRTAISDGVCSRVSRQLGLTGSVHKLGAPLSIGQWLGEIANAGCVVTNSFHGLCFALIFQRPFVVLGFDGGDAWRNERHRDLLRSVKCDAEIVTSVKQVSSCRLCCRSSISVEQLRTVGLQFLSSNLKDKEAKDGEECGNLGGRS